MAEQIKIDIATAYDDKAAKKALTDAEKIDKLKPEIEITADDQASDDLKQVTKEVEKVDALKPELDIGIDIDKVINGLDDVVAETKKVQAAADALGNALGPELAAKADTTAIVRDLQKAGITLDEITANADQLGSKLKEVADTDVGGKLGANLGTARGKLDEVNKSAESSRSALANMVGNSAQDLGALGGIAGSTGVAIGQMAEYASDAALAGESMGSALSSMAAVAGPIAAMSLAIQGVNSILNAMKQGQAVTKAFDTKQVQQFTDAIEAGDQATEHYQETLAKTGEVLADTGVKAGPAWTKILPGVSDLTRALGLWGKFGDNIEDILPTLNKAGISADDWTKIVTAGADKQVGAMDALRSALDKTNLSDDERHDILIGARAAQDNYNNSVSSGTELHKFFRDSVDASNEQLATYVDWLYKQGAANRDATDAATAARQEEERTTNAALQHRDAIARVNVERDRVDAKAELRRERDAVQDVIDKYKEMQNTLSDKKSLLLLQQGFDDMRAKAVEAWTASAEGADDAEQKQRDYQIAQIDTIQNALDYISTIEGIPAKATTDIEALVDQGKYNEALHALEILSAPRSVSLIATLNEQALRSQLLRLGIKQSAAGSGNYGGGPTVVGEDGPEIVNLPAGSQIIPAPVSAAMMHNGYGSGGTMTVNINMPKGSRGVDVVKQVSGQARRSGRRYGTPVVHYARL